MAVRGGELAPSPIIRITHFLSQRAPPFFVATQQRMLVLVEVP